jgi:hypothetical protein
MAIYVGLSEIKAAADVTGTTYDAVLVRMASHASGLIERAAGRQFWPELATRYFDGSGEADLWLPEPVLAITTLQLSDDSGDSYTETPVENTDWWASDGNVYGRSPTQLLVMNPNGSYSVFYSGRRAVKITGVWGWHRDYAAAWQNSKDALAASVTAAATTLTVADADGADAMGLTPRFDVGQLLRIDDEYMTVTTVTAGTTNSLSVVRACNGTTAAIHAKDAVIYVWRADELVRQATLIQAVRWFKRGQSAFQDVSAALELGQLTFARKVDPEVEFMLLDAGLRRLAVG